MSSFSRLYSTNQRWNDQKRRLITHKGRNEPVLAENTISGAGSPPLYEPRASIDPLGSSAWYY